MKIYQGNLRGTYRFSYSVVTFRLDMSSLNFYKADISTFAIYNNPSFQYGMSVA